ncbi:MAG: hypothetical protein MJ108_05600 [Saccharofermentans sp.]|nr:hypothetical protein [Saccharofermentans sp.]
MGIGRRIFKDVMRDITRSSCCVHHHHHDDLGAAVAKVVTVAVGAMVANEVVKKHYNPDGLKGAFEDLINNNIKGVRTGTVNNRIPYADGIVAKLAACSYVAKIDNSITGEEQAELDMSISDILSIENLPSVYKDEINAIRNSSDTSFSSIQPYLDRVDGNVLVSYLIDVKNIARANGGISDAEAKAISVYKNYVTKRTGYTFPEDNEEVELDLTCKGCGGAMELDTTYGKAICPYCGSMKLVNVDVVNRIIGR